MGRKVTKAIFEFDDGLTAEFAEESAKIIWSEARLSRPGIPFEFTPPGCEKSSVNKFERVNIPVGMDLADIEPSGLRADIQRPRDSIV